MSLKFHPVVVDVYLDFKKAKAGATVAEIWRDAGLIVSSVLGFGWTTVSVHRSSHGDEWSRTVSATARICVEHEEAMEAVSRTIAGVNEVGITVGGVTVRRAGVPQP